MAGVSANPLSTLSIASVPKISAKSQQYPNRIMFPTNDICSTSFGIRHRSSNNNRIRTLNAAGLSDYEPDLREDPIDRWDNLSISDDDFVYGVYDGHHTYNEGDDTSTFWGSIKEDYAAINPPTGFQGLISWLFLPSVALGMYLNVPGEYLYIGAAIFIVIFCIIEMDKPSEAYNFEPQIYNMERGARDKLISDYNTMDIWDFNEKYGDLWDFTVTKDDIMKSISELSEWIESFDLLSEVTLTRDSDTLVWKGKKDGIFTVKSVKKMLVTDRNSAAEFRMNWIGWVPLKCSIFVWRIAMNRIPTALELAKRNVASKMCRMCDFEDETVDHLFTSCGMTTGVWLHISAWCRVVDFFFFFFSTRDIIGLYDSHNMDKKKKKVIFGIVFVAYWCLWKKRNELIFKKQRVKVGDILANIKSF